MSFQSQPGWPRRVAALALVMAVVALLLWAPLRAAPHGPAHAAPVAADAARAEPVNLADVGAP